MLNFFKKKMLEKQEIKEIKKSLFFDEKYYLETYKDVALSGVDPIVHYYHYGWKEGRNPNKLFNTHGYLRRYSDVACTEFNPLLHYIKHGRREKRYMSESGDIDCYSRFKVLDKKFLDIENFALSTVVIFHIYGGELAEEMALNAANLPKEFDIVITTDSEASINKIKLFFDQLCNKVTYLIVHNIGFDTAALIIACKEIVLQYDIFCCCHNKQSKQNSFGDGWRRYLLRSLFGTKSTINQIYNKFVESDTLGIAYPPMYPMVNLYNLWTACNNKHNTELFLKRIGINYSISLEDSFPVGAMFWARTKAVLPIFLGNIEYSDFETEKLPDGQLGHHIERAWSIVAKASGFKIFEYLAPFGKTIFKIDLNIKRHVIYQCREYTKVDEFAVTNLLIVSNRITVICNSNNSFCNSNFDDRVVFLHRRNKGMDFGAWRDVIHYYGYDYLSNYDELVLCNDSCFFPLCDIREMFSVMENDDCDFWGHTKHPPIIFKEHIQSYFLVFKKNVFMSNEFKIFFARVPNYTKLQDLIDNLESQLTSKLAKKFAYNTYHGVPDDANLHFDMYRSPLSYLVMGAPFLKKKSFDYMADDEVFFVDIIESLTDYPIVSMIQDLAKNDIIK